MTQSGPVLGTTGIPITSNAPAENVPSDSEREALALTKALEHYSILRERGEAPSVDQFVSLYLGMETELRECLLSAERLEQFAANDATEMLDNTHLELRRLGDYRLIRKVGQGGMGIVYEAEQTSLGRRVAIKVLPALASLDPRAKIRFQNEVHAAALLDHPNIVGVIGVGLERGIHFFAMKFVNGRSLSEIVSGIKDTSLLNGDIDTRFILDLLTSADVAPACRDDLETPLSLSSVRERLSADYFRFIANLGYDAANALNYAHENGIVHRDIKPSNLMIDSKGKLCVTDFGLADFDTAMTLTMPGDFIGTLRYMSPEQANHGTSQVDFRTDIYSLGTTLYELLTLQRMVAGTTREEVLSNLTTGRPESIRKWVPQVPTDLVTIILKATEKAPQDRYANCKELADDLDRFLHLRPIVGRRPTLRRRTIRWAQRNPGTARLLWIAAALFAFLGMGVGWYVDSAQRELQLQRETNKHQRILSEISQKTVKDNHYVTAINRIEHSLRLHRKIEARKMFDESEISNKQSFAWRLTRELLKPATTLVASHDGPAYGLQLSPDDSRLASCGSDGVRIWRCATWELETHLRDASMDVNSVAWSGDGSKLACVGDDGKALIYDSASWKLIHTGTCIGPLCGVAFSADDQGLYFGQRVDAGRGVNQIFRWQFDENKPEPISDVLDSQVQGIALSRDGMLLTAVTQFGRVYLWKIREGEHKQSSFDFSIRDGRKFERHAVAIASSKTLLAFPGDPHSICLIDANTGTLSQRLDGCDSQVEGLTFSRDDRTLIAVSRTSGIYLWQQGQDDQWWKVSEISGEDQLWASCISQDGSVFLAGQNGKIVAFNKHLASAYRRFPLVSNADEIAHYRASLAPSPSSRMQELATARYVEGHTQTVDGLYSFLAFNEESTKAFSCAQGQAYSMDLRSLNSGMETMDWSRFVQSEGIISTNDHVRLDGVSRTFVTPDGRAVAGNCGDGRILIDFANGSSTTILENGNSDMPMAISPGGEILACGDDREIRLWDVATARLILRLPLRAIALGSLAFSPDGNRMAAMVRGVHGGNELLLWEVPE